MKSIRSFPEGEEEVITTITMVSSLAAASPPAESTKYRKLSDHYEMHQLLGRGSFGHVYLSTVKCSGQTVAIKQVGSNYANELHNSTRREIFCLQALQQHANIVKLLEVCRELDLSWTAWLTRPWSQCFGKLWHWTTRPSPNVDTFLVLEYCEFDLAKLLEPPMNVRFSLGEKKSIMQQLLSAVSAMHGEGIIHRDLKEANILVTKHGVLKVADFGLSRSLLVPGGGGLDYDPADCGLSQDVATLWYRAPELLLLSPAYGPPVDLWSVGVIMFQLWHTLPILDGDNERQQLLLISKLCGSITEESMPTCAPEIKEMKGTLPADKTRLVCDKAREIVEDNSAIDLIDRLLTLEPKERPSAMRALEHNFFSEGPPPESIAAKLATVNQADDASVFIA